MQSLFSRFNTAEETYIFSFHYQNNCTVQRLVIKNWALPWKTCCWKTPALAKAKMS